MHGHSKAPERLTPDHNILTTDIIRIYRSREVVEPTICSMGSVKYKTNGRKSSNYMESKTSPHYFKSQNYKKPE